jgi:hypothetical protein
VIVSGQFECVGFLCPTWKLNMARIDSIWKPTEGSSVPLAELLPKAPTAEMSFPVFTAYDPDTRTYYLAGLHDEGGWGHRPFTASWRLL